MNRGRSVLIYSQRRRKYLCLNTMFFFFLVYSGLFRLYVSRSVSRFLFLNATFLLYICIYF